MMEDRPFETPRMRAARLEREMSVDQLKANTRRFVREVIRLVVLVLALATIALNLWRLS